MDYSFRIYQNLKITHADPDHLFLAITQNWAMRLFVGFVMQGHIWTFRKLQNYQTIHFCTVLHRPTNSPTCKQAQSEAL